MPLKKEEDGAPIDSSRIALLDTSGYASDCNLAALLPQHAMKPYRMLATMELVRALRLDALCRTVVPPLVEVEALEAYHADTLVANLGVHNTESWMWNPETSKVFYSGDCPPVEGIIEHSVATASGTIMGAVLLNSGRVDIAMHWGGGMHHAKCGECSGFCYVNDIVLGIIELLKCHERVLYIDLDMHHGDGVDEAFCQSDRVFTLSLHKFGESFFPGTGAPSDIGVGRGRHYTMNLSLWDGINDFFYISIFTEALSKVVAHFAPDAVVLQLGADSLAEDRLGLFNLSSWGHGRCVELVRQLRLPLLAVGGGGYTIRNVAKLWAYETSILCGRTLPLSTTIPVDAMPCTGWLFEDAPLLHVPQDESNYTSAVLNTQRAYRNTIAQIDAHVGHIQPHPRLRRQQAAAEAATIVPPVEQTV
ncbi:histone deacetylase 1/2 [Strigomonas culicis]|uniref:Histone deacetylase n=1 Tax=Strigomonas culicis TaxID=28005 RepID=S9UII0_9TRYP|nr:histone deacetylase 1/2 [Strigomonas culicis]|eukprot:EPY28539.1 histone deacetylase 1/2 [Strigomonas culicis]